jgi:fluoride ion exporter CrcB/FEX
MFVHLQAGDFLIAALYVSLSILLGLLAVWLGVWLGRVAF